CLAAQPDIASAVRSVATPFGVNLPAQAAAIAALEPKALAETARRAGLVAAERDRVVAALREDGWVVPQAQG
ncbi:Histidinol-phosphate aminotransferase 1, partial [human gut metagenome]